MRKAPLRILAIDPIPKGFAFVVLEGEHLLLDWGYRTKGNDPKTLLIRFERLMASNDPDVVVMEETGRASHRRPVALCFLASAAKVAVRMGLRVERIPIEDVRMALAPEGKTKVRIAEYIVERFPELMDSFPRPRNWYDTGEDERVGIFDAAALVAVCRDRVGRPTALGRDLRE